MDPSLAGVIISSVIGGSVILTATIIKFKGNNKSNPNSIPNPSKCTAHSGIIADIENNKTDILELKNGQLRIETSINNIKDDMNNNTAIILKAIGNDRNKN